ncbi:MAG: hypothetical protein M0R80_13725 [Proteobacteria bacterium]|jgi:hypothetical protein|nr:hypothetical protein [Pseudomonadota bacterium]
MFKASVFGDDGDYIEVTGTAFASEEARRNFDKIPKEMADKSAVRWVEAVSFGYSDWRDIDLDRQDVTTRLMISWR